MNDTGTPAQREPTCSIDESEHVRHVRELVIAEIAAAGGWLSFERYMDLVLYAPGLGYYSAGARKLGPDGDFTTAPEVSALFGACVARQCAEVLERLGDASILEIGAGNGTLAAELLEQLERADRLPARYRILEISADLRMRQRECLQRRTPHLLDRVEWLDAPPSLAFDGIILANEVLDALPVRRFRWSAAQVEEMGVVDEGATLGWRQESRARRRRRPAVGWPRPVALGTTGTSRNIVRGSGRGPRRSRARYAPARFCGSTTDYRVRIIICRSAAMAPCSVIFDIAQSRIRSACPACRT